MSEPGKPKYKRILLKLSGEALQNKGDSGCLDADTILGIAQQLKAVQDLGTQVAVVVGAGNIYRGLKGAKAGGIQRTAGDQMGMLATVINALAIEAVLESIDVPARVMTAQPMPASAEPFFRRRAIEHLEAGCIVIFGAGTGNPFFTTDSAAALRASEIGADVVLKATKVDGVYDKDPMEHDDAVRYEAITYQQALADRLGIMDASAFSLCMENEIPIIVFNFFKDGETLRVVQGESVGTLVHK